MSAINMFVVVLAEAGGAGKAGERIAIPRRWPTWALLGSVVLGPIGHITSFPLLFYVGKAILAALGLR